MYALRVSPFAGISLLALSALACGTEPSGQPAMLVLTRAPHGWMQTRVPISRAPIAQLADADGNAMVQVGTEITVAITSGEGTVVGVPSVRTDTTGAATFEELALAGPVGEKTLTFSSPGLLSASSSINLTAGPAASIAASGGNGQSAATGTPVSSSPSVLVTDVDGNPVGDITVTFAVVSGGGSITGESPSTDAAGLATVGSWMLGPTAGTNTLTATAEGLTGSPVTFIATGTIPFLRFVCGRRCRLQDTMVGWASKP